MTTDAPPERNKVFISYSRKDREWVERVRTHLRPLERDPSLRVNIWDDSEIEAGSYWMDEIKNAIASTRAVVLLVSAAFIASDFIESNELPPLLEAARKEGVRILPLHIKPSRFVKTAGLSHFQSVNDPAEPLLGLTEAEQEEVLVALADAVERAFSQPPHALREQTPPPPPEPVRVEAKAETAPADTKTDAARAEPTTPPPRQSAQTLKELPLVESMLEELWDTLDDKFDSDDSLSETAALIADAVLLDGLRAIARRAHPKVLSRTLAQASDALREYVRGLSRRLETKEQVSQLLRYATAGDSETCRLAELVLNTGRPNHTYRVEIGQHTDEVEIVSGMTFDRGHLSPDFVHPSAAQKSVLNDVYIYVTGEKIAASEHLRPVFLSLFRFAAYNSLLIVADDIKSEALHYVRGEMNPKIAVVKSPGSGDHRREILSDIAALTGGEVWGEGGTLPLDEVSVFRLGRADSVIVTDEQTIISGARGKGALIQARLDEIRRRIAGAASEYDREQLEGRLKQLTGGVAIVRVGGKTDGERQRKAASFNRVLRHYEAALSPGIVPGEHLTLANAAAWLRARPAAEKLADTLLADALELPLRRVAEDFARDGDETLRLIRDRQAESQNPYVGYYGEEDSFVDLFEVGAVVPAKNVLAIMQEAVEAASQKLAALRFTDEVVREVAAVEGR